MTVTGLFGFKFTQKPVPRHQLHVHRRVMATAVGEKHTVAGPIGEEGHDRVEQRSMPGERNIGVILSVDQMPSTVRIGSGLSP